MSSSLWPHGLQHASLLHPSLSLRDCSNSCPLSQWCCLTILFSDALIFLSIRVFSNDLVLCIRCQSIGTLASALIFPSIQGLFPSGLTGLISLKSKGLSRVFSSPTSQKAAVLQCTVFFMVQLSHPYMTTGKTIALTIWILLAKWCLCFLTYCLGLS